mgnify:CR=1 FL=1
MDSVNKKIAVKQIRSGLSIYKAGRSPYWQARIWDARAKKYIVRSTKETNRLEAAEVAEEVMATFKSKQNTNHAATKNRSFEHYARVYSKMKKFESKSARNQRSYSDEHKLLYRETDGIVSYFGNYDVGKITSGMVRDYLHYLDERREAPLAPSTKAKHGMMIGKVLSFALDDGVIDIIPTMPKLRTKDSPRVSFTGAEYKRLITTARTIAAAGNTEVRGVKVRPEHVDMWTFMVHSFLRPTERELFGLRHSDVIRKGKPMNEDDPLHLELELQGKTGFRTTATMPRAYHLYDHLVDDRVHFDSTD